MELLKSSTLWGRDGTSLLTVVETAFQNFAFAGKNVEERRGILDVFFSDICFSTALLKL